MSIVGYARVSTTEQDEAGRVPRLRTDGCEAVYVDHASGRDLDRPQWRLCLASLKRSDSLVVVRLDRLGRSLVDLIETIELLGERGVEFRSLSEAFDTSTLAGTLTFQITAVFAQYERALIQERTREGLANARSRGAHIERPPALNVEQVGRILADQARTDDDVQSNSIAVV